MSSLRNIAIFLALAATACSGADEEVTGKKYHGYRYDAVSHCVIDPEPVVLYTSKSSIGVYENVGCFVHAERQLIAGHTYRDDTYGDEGWASCEHEPWFADSPYYPPRPMEDRLCPEDE